MSTILLKLLDGDGRVIRGMMDEEDHYFSVYNFINHSCQKPEKSSYGNTVFFRLVQDSSKFKDEVLTLCKNLKFPGSGQKETPCMNIRGLQRLLMILGGKVAAEYRELAEGTFTRVMAGDLSLIEVIQANAVSDAPIQKVFRAALVQEPVVPVLDELCLGKKRERDDLLFDMEMTERKAALEERKAALEERKAALEERKLKHASNVIEHGKTAMGAINALKDWVNVDERTKLQVEDHMKNVMFNAMAVQSSSLAITDGTQPTQPAVSATAGLSVSIVAKELGHKCSEGDLQRIGRAMAKKYRETYKSDPSKHTQYVGGSCIPVNSYMERDRAMMEQVIKSVMAKNR
jgi:hypothetical protein